MSDSLSPLAQANLTAIQALANAMQEGVHALKGDLADPENQTNESLTGDEVLSLLQATMSVCAMWAKMAEKIVVVQPEYLEWVAAQDLAGDLKPGLND